MRDDRRRGKKDPRCTCRCNRARHQARLVRADTHPPAGFGSSPKSGDQRGQADSAGTTAKWSHESNWGGVERWWPRGIGHHQAERPGQQRVLYGMRMRGRSGALHCVSTTDHCRDHRRGDCRSHRKLQVVVENGSLPPIQSDTRRCPVRGGPRMPHGLAMQGNDAMADHRASRDETIRCAASTDITNTPSTRDDKETIL